MDGLVTSFLDTVLFLSGAFLLKVTTCCGQTMLTVNAGGLRTAKE